MFQKRPPTVVVALSLILFILLVFSLWVRQESALYKELLVYQHELQYYQSKCFKIESRESIEHKSCPLGFISLHGRCSPCLKETFSLPHWTSCSRRLTCDDIQDAVRPSSKLWEDEKWQCFLAEWNSYQVIFTKLKDEFEEEVDMEEVISVMQELTPHPNLLYPIGSCTSTKTIVFGMMDQVFRLTQLDSFLTEVGCDNWMVRFKLAIDYVRILNYLHLHSSGPYVLCNSHSIALLLSQFVVSQHMQLLLANFDNLPYGQLPVVCSQQQLHGDFVAPEQKWPYSHLKMFNPDEQPGYFYTSDIWKVPDVTQAILGKSRESRKISNYLLAIHHRCKNLNHLQRPSASEILTEYENVWLAAVGESIPSDDSIHYGHRSHGSV